MQRPCWRGQWGAAASSRDSDTVCHLGHGEETRPGRDGCWRGARSDTLYFPYLPFVNTQCYKCVYFYLYLNICESDKGWSRICAIYIHKIIPVNVVMIILIIIIIIITIIVPWNISLFKLVVGYPFSSKHIFIVTIHDNVIILAMVVYSKVVLQRLYLHWNVGKLFVEKVFFFL